MYYIAYSTRFALIMLALGFAFAFAAPVQADVKTFKIDSAHSFANWQLRHIVAITSGTFYDVNGSVTLDLSNIANSSVNATISTYSLNSSHQRRDLHTLTDEFLDARNFPEIKFVSSAIAPETAEKGKLTGQLTLHGVTKPITMNYQILGFGPDPWGGMRAGFKATTRINRSDYGISKFTPTGPVGNEVDITLLIEGIELGADGKPWNASAAAAEKAKVISYPMPIAPTPEAQPTPVTAPAVALPAPIATPQPAAAGTAEKVEPSMEDQLKKKLKGLFK